MMKIAIVPFVTNGRGSQVGHDGHFNVFRKSRSTVLRENLENGLKEAGISAEVIVDVNHGDLKALKREGVTLMLLPSDVAIYVDYSGISSNEYYKLSENEYENGEVAHIIEYIKAYHLD